MNFISFFLVECKYQFNNEKETFDRKNYNKTEKSKQTNS